MFDFGLTNEEQRAAASHEEGPLLIIAGPGTGKTYTLVKRIAYLVAEKGVKPEEIMVVTFTEKAAKELITRVSDEFLRYDVNINMNDMYIGTFHSVCLRILKENSEYIEDDKKQRMMDAFEQTYLVCKNIENFNMLRGYNEHIGARRGVWEQALLICKYVNQLMEELVDINSLVLDRDEDMKFLGRLVVRYKELLDRSSAMDFSSIQTKTYDMLTKHPEILKKLQDSIRYIMVDEYQDTNYIQECLVFLIAGDRKNICVVGDDDQGMYRFRGATIRNILEFPDKFEKGSCRVIHLDKNYRSEPGIINFYNDWMNDADNINLFNWDKYRYSKMIKPASPGKLESSVYTCGGGIIDNEKEELLSFIEGLLERKNITNLNQVAILFRSVKGSEAMEIADFLEEHNIPIYSPRSDMFFYRYEVKLTLGLIMMCFKTYLQDLKKNSFTKGIPDRLREYYIDCLRCASAHLKNEKSLYEYINQVSSKIFTMGENSEAEDFGLLDILYQMFAYNPFKMYLDASLNDSVIKTRAARNLSEISRLIARYNFLHDMHQISFENKISMPEELFNTYFRYLFIDGIGEYEDEAEYAPSGCISFMTIHQSKGLEFPVVVVGSLSNSPRRDSDPLMMTVELKFFKRPPYEPYEDIKYFDFWRLYYTAFSRAKNLLVLAVKKDSKYFNTFLGMLRSTSEFDSFTRFEELKKIRYKHVYSFTSHIAVYDGCPTQYKLYKEYGFAQNKMFHTSVGTLVHATLEDMNNCIIDGHLDRVSEEEIKKWFSLNYKSMQEVTGYYLTDEQRENALNQVIRYFHHRKDELGRVWKAEEEINLVLPEYILQGVIDLVEGVDDTVEIVDYKTGPKPDIEGHPERVSHYRKQLEIYAYLIEKRYHKKVSRMHLYYTSTMSGNPLISFDWQKENIDNTIGEIDETVKNIESKCFDKKVQNNYACRFCDMRYYCGKE